MTIEKDKWNKFHLKHNPAEMVNYEPGSGNISADLIRAARPSSNEEKKKNGVYINGRALCEFSADNHPPGTQGTYDFNTVPGIRAFFSSELLGKMPSGKKKEANIDYLMKSFNQGGFLFPVTAAMDKPIKDAGYIMDNNTRGQLSQFVSTPNGFKVQEYFVAPNLRAQEKEDIKKTTEYLGALRHAYIVYTGETDFSVKAFEDFYKRSNEHMRADLNNAYQDAIKAGGTIIGDLVNRDAIFENSRWPVEIDALSFRLALRDRTHKYQSTNITELLSGYTKSPDIMASLDENPVIRAVATLDVNLNHVRQVLDEDGQKIIQAAPRITVKDSVIQYGNEDVKKMLDKRSLGWWLVDFFKHLLRIAFVKDISPKVKDPQLPIKAEAPHAQEALNGGEDERATPRPV